VKPKSKKIIRALDEEEELEEPEEASVGQVEDEVAPKVMSAEDKLAFDEVFSDPRDI
jgi:hypothetical protein